MDQKRGRRTRVSLAAALTVGLMLASGCTAQPRPGLGSDVGQGASTPTDTGTNQDGSKKDGTKRVALPPVGASFDYQIGGPYPPVDGVGIVGRDYSEAPVPGLYNICYVNAFQSQPQDGETWAGERADLVLVGEDAQPVIDEAWAEPLLDTRTAGKRRRIADIVGGWIDACANKGFDAVEPDNLDSWTRSNKLLSEDDNVALAKLLAERAHSRGLAIAQKNTVELGTAGRDDIGFDFAMAEECVAYEECRDYIEVYDRHIIDIEYSDNPRLKASDCFEFATMFSITIRDRNVVPEGHADYRFEPC